MKKIFLLIILLLGTYNSYAQSYRFTYKFTAFANSGPDFGSGMRFILKDANGTTTQIYAINASHPTVQNLREDVTYDVLVNTPFVELSIVTFGYVTSMGGSSQTRRYNLNSCLKPSDTQTSDIGTTVNFNITQYPLENFRSLNMSVGNEFPECQTKTLTAYSNCTENMEYSAHYKTSISGPETELIPFGNHGTQFSLDGSDFVSVPVNSNIYIFLRYLENDSSSSNASDAIIFKYEPCSPELEGPPRPIQPTCINSDNNSDNNNGSFTITFNRELDDTKQEKMNLVVLLKEGNNFNAIEADVLTKNRFTNRSFTWDLVGLPAGTYKVGWQTKSNNEAFDDINNVPDAYAESTPFTLTAPPALSVSGSGNNVTCAGGNDGSITAIANGGTPPYTYAIDGTTFQSGTLFDELSKGDYTITIKDKNDCITTSDVITISEVFPNPPNVIGLPGLITDPTTIDGNNGVITISVSGGSGSYPTYTWTKDNNVFTPPDGSTNTRLIDLFEGVYTVVVTDSNGCSSEEESFTLTDPEPIEITISMSPDVVDCADAQVNLTAKASKGYLATDSDYTYTWNNGTMGPTLFSVGIGTYEVTVTDDGGNSNQREFIVQGPDPIRVTVTDTKELSCRDGSDAAIRLDILGGTGDYVITWENLLDPDFSAFGPAIENIGFGAYIYRVVDQNGCPVTNTSNPIEVNNPSPFTIDLGEDPFFCEGQTVTLSAAISDPDASYSWTSTTGFASTDPDITVTQEGTYTATVTSGKGCVAKDDIEVIENIKEIAAAFLYASQVFTNERFVVVDVTFPVPEAIEWILPQQAQIVSQDQDLIELYFENPGSYEIAMIAKLGTCQDTYTQKVLVLQKETLEGQDTQNPEPQLANIQEFTVYPNPSDGQFSAKVVLAAPKEVSVKVFNLTNNTLLTQVKETGKSEYNIPFSFNAASGIYAVVLETQYGNAIRKVVVR